MRKPLVVGNWKMHGGLSRNAGLLDALSKGLGADAAADSGAHVSARVLSDCAVCVPFPYLHQVRSLLGSSPVRWGAQNVSEHAEGAYTGEVSAAMLREFGCEYVIVGHSERRQLYGESSATVAKKYAVAMAAGLKPILCVGETLEQRESGRTEAVVGEQLEAVLQAVGPQGISVGVLAYEPVWAIGTGKTASPEQAQAVHAYLRGQVAGRDAGAAAGLRILYGGSVKAANAGTLFGQKDIDGGLVGGASLQADELISICLAAKPKA